MTSLPLLASKTSHGCLTSLTGSVVADDGIGKLAVHLNVFLVGERMVIYVIDPPAVEDVPNSESVPEGSEAAFVGWVQSTNSQGLTELGMLRRSGAGNAPL